MQRQSRKVLRHLFAITSTLSLQPLHFNTVTLNIPLPRRLLKRLACAKLVSAEAYSLSHSTMSDDDDFMQDSDQEQ